MKQQSSPPPPAAGDGIAFESLAEGQKAHGFTAVAQYLDDRDRPIGARFRHDDTGFLLELVRIETAPQAFIWINTFPTSDQGEPHTQEHLLLGKGNKGRWVGSLEAMSLAESSAFTMQWRTCYHVHTIAGPEVFWNVLDAKMSGLLEPDYSDEEIRREVSHFGIAEDPKTGALRLEEKGTVYNEMVRSFENPGWVAWRELDHMLYGPKHPLALVSGGYPADIRTMTPQDIRSFHHQSHHLANMGMIAALPRAVALGDALTRTDAMLDKLHARLDKQGRAVKTEQDLPPPDSAPAGTIKVVRYPHASADKAGDVTLAWPPVRDLPLAEQTLVQLFLGSFAGDETTTLYKKLIDSSTRVHDFGATSVAGWMASERGHAVYIGLSDVAVAHLDEAGAERIRGAVLAELKRVAGLPDGDPELVALNSRVKNRIVETRRGLAKFLNSPPGFGYRGTSAAWMEFLHSLEDSPRFARSLTLRPELAWIEQQLGDGTRNLWGGFLARWKLLDPPYAVANRSDPGLMARERAERDARARAELDRLKQAWGLTDDAAVLARYKKEYDARTAELEAAGKHVPMPKFIDSPPMTDDDALVWDRRSLPRKVPLIASTFDSMTGGSAGIAFDLRGVPEEQLRWIGVLPMLLTDVGVIEEGKPIPYDEMRERQRKEILSIDVRMSINHRTGRAELVARGSGNDPDETERSIHWMELVLHHPDWRKDNLPRIRDLVDQAAQGIRNRMLGAEEGWVDDPPTIWWKQHDPLAARTSSFLTRTHDLFRLRWSLRDPATPVDRKALDAYFAKLAGAGKLGRQALGQLTGNSKKKVAAVLAAYRGAYQGLPASARTVAGDALKDLAQILPDLPDGSLAADWAYLVDAIRRDLARPATEVLAEIEALRGRILTSAGARSFAIGAAPTLERIQGRMGRLVETLGVHPVEPATYKGNRFIAERLRARNPAATAPLFVGLVNPNTQGGVHLHSAPGPAHTDTDEAALLRYLAGNLYTGHGAHSIFMKTWAAGLAYSNGLRPSIRGARLRYYAERCPELPQTLGFVIRELERAAKTEKAPAIAEYAVAQAFESRVAASFESRGEGIAADLADGETPEVVKTFRSRLLALYKARGDRLADELFDLMPTVYAQVLPGWKVDPRTVKDAVYFVIGPDSQLDRWQEYLHKSVSPDATLYRLYPRDFWLP